MKHNFNSFFIVLLSASLLLAACSPAAPAVEPQTEPVNVLAVESFLADITRNVAGDRLTVDTLIPVGIDPHAFQPTPQDVVRISESQVLIINGAHFEEWLEKTLVNAGGERLVIEASGGLVSRNPSANEIVDADHEGDPHFWLDPNNVIKYVENIRDGLSQVDPAGKSIYSDNADRYIARLKELDQWITAQVSQIPEQDRQLVTNHESFGYFADRYGFRITGTVIPSTSSDAAPSAQQVGALVDLIRQSGAKAIFIETGANPQLAEQIAQETGATLITDLYTHSVSDSSGAAASYIDMMKHNVEIITAALK